MSEIDAFEWDTFQIKILSWRDRIGYGPAMAAFITAGLTPGLAVKILAVEGNLYKFTPSMKNLQKMYKAMKESP